MSNFFERYSRIIGKELPDPSALTLDEKCLLASRLSSVGETKTSIAAYLGVSRTTVYTYLNRVIDQEIQELENKRYLEKYMERLNELEVQRDYYRRILETVRESGDYEEMDPKTGRMIPKTSHLRNLAEVGRLVRDYDRMILELEQVVGFIPKHNPSELFTTLTEYDPKTKDLASVEVDLLSESEIEEILMTKLQKRPPKLGKNALSELKDEKLI